MILGFLGKGGSGKSTVATLFTKYLLENKKTVLAIDNDHNMDFSYNLDAPSSMNYIGQGLDDVFSYMGITSTLDTLVLPQNSFFAISPKDPITEKYSIDKGNGLHLMIAGPHTEEIMIGKQCSHVMTTPLKAYLPFFALNENEYVIIDEKAGADGVGTGITTGFNAGVIIVEPTPHGIKAALQIAKMLRFYNTPYYYILNKVRAGTNIEEIQKQLDKRIIGVLSYGEAYLDLSLQQETKNVFSYLCDELKKLQDTRKVRSESRLQKLKSMQ